MIEKVSADIVIVGLVQGVGFRAFVKNHANLLGLKGYVMNTDDRNKVKIELEGSKNDIEQLIEKLKRRPVLSSIDDISIRWDEYKGNYKDFSIRC